MRQHPKGLPNGGALLDGQKWTARLNLVHGWLMTPVHASSLCLFRVVYAYVMLAQIMKWANMFEIFQTSLYTLHYPGVGWVHPVSPAVGNFLLATCFCSSIALGVGFKTRIASILNYLIFAYLFHICHSFYNNHYVLMCHINFVGCFVNWGTWGGLDVFLRKRAGKRTESTVPYWHLLLMQLLFCVPYFWGAVAKMNSDWLFRAEPLIMWFSRRDEWFYRQWWFPWFIAWTGMLYDLVISFLLMWKRTRFVLGFPAAIFFNCSNKLMFNIGVFPFAMIASLVLFLDPDQPAKWWKIVVEPPPPASGLTDDLPRVNSSEEEENEKYMHRGRGSVWHKRYVLTFVFGFILFHSLYPLRHFVLYESNPSWTEEGHTGAWHMKLRSKRGWVYLNYVEENGNVTTIAPYLDPHVSHAQLRKIEPRPDDLLTYAARFEKVYNEGGRKITAIHAISCFSLNNNPYRQLYVSKANLKDYIGQYERIGVSGVGKWIYSHESAPECSKKNPLRDPLKDPLREEYDGETKENKVIDTFRELYHAAHFYSARELDLDDESHRHVYHVLDNKRTPAYIWNL